MNKDINNPIIITIFLFLMSLGLVSLSFLLGYHSLNNYLTFQTKKTNYIQIKANLSDLGISTSKTGNIMYSPTYNYIVDNQIYSIKVNYQTSFKPKETTIVWYNSILPKMSFFEMNIFESIGLIIGAILVLIAGIFVFIKAVKLPL